MKKWKYSKGDGVIVHQLGDADYLLGSLQQHIDDMATSSARRYLTENGFRLIKQANHGEVWEDGVTRIMVSRNAEAEHPGLKKDVRNAVAKRNPQPAGTVFTDPPVSPKQIVEIVMEATKQEKEKTTTKGPRQLPLLVMTILTDPDLSSDQKVKMIMAYAELG